jgi:hypothetical protein
VNLNDQNNFVDVFICFYTMMFSFYADSFNETFKSQWYIPNGTKGWRLTKSDIEKYIFYHNFWFENNCTEWNNYLISTLSFQTTSGGSHHRHSSHSSSHSHQQDALIEDEKHRHRHHRHHHHKKSQEDHK